MPGRSQIVCRPVRRVEFQNICNDVCQIECQTEGQIKCQDV